METSQIKIYTKEYPNLRTFYELRDPDIQAKVITFTDTYFDTPEYILLKNNIYLSKRSYYISHHNPTLWRLVCNNTLVDTALVDTTNILQILMDRGMIPNTIEHDHLEDYLENYFQTQVVQYSFERYVVKKNRYIDIVQFNGGGKEYMYITVTHHKHLCSAHKHSTPEYVPAVKKMIAVISKMYPILYQDLFPKEIIDNTLQNNIFSSESIFYQIVKDCLENSHHIMDDLSPRPLLCVSQFLQHDPQDDHPF